MRSRLLLPFALILVGSACRAQQTCNDITNTHTIEDLAVGATGQIPYTQCSVLNGNLFIECTTSKTLDSLEILSNVEQITGSVTIQNCKDLVNLDGLEKLRYIGGDLTIINNNNLEDIQALERLDVVKNGVVSIYRNPRLCYIDLMRFDRIATSVNFVQIPNCLETTCDASCSCGFCGGPDTCLESCEDPSLAWVAGPVVAVVLVLALLIVYTVYMCKHGDCSCDCFFSLTDPIEFDYEPQEIFLPTKRTSQPLDGKELIRRLSERQAPLRQAVDAAPQSQPQPPQQNQPQAQQDGGDVIQATGEQQQPGLSTAPMTTPRVVMPMPRVAQPIDAARLPSLQQRNANAATPSAIRLPRLRPQSQGTPVIRPMVVPQVASPTRSRRALPPLQEHVTTEAAEPKIPPSVPEPNPRNQPDTSNDNNSNDNSTANNNHHHNKNDNNTNIHDNSSDKATNNSDDSTTTKQSDATSTSEKGSEQSKPSSDEPRPSSSTSNHEEQPAETATTTQDEATTEQSTTSEA
eukprot:m.219593 g.219593  ORF g.219593 m.219593 type:complete len:519 (+) comp17003_c1_seq1:4549-6105(+)